MQDSPIENVIATEGDQKRNDGYDNDSNSVGIHQPGNRKHQICLYSRPRQVSVDTSECLSTDDGVEDRKGNHANEIEHAGYDDSIVAEGVS